MEATDEKWQDYWDLHVMAAVRLARGLAPLMKARGGGVILHNASICAAQPLWYEPIYNTTKAALMMFSKCLATELVGDNIRVNCVNPGLILTPDWIKTAKQLTADTGGDWQGYLDGVAGDSADQALRHAAELANFFVFLCSERASYSVGSTYFVDGGCSRQSERAWNRSAAAKGHIGFMALSFPSPGSRMRLMTPTTPGTWERVGLGALPLVGQLDLAGHGHPAVFDLDCDPMARNGEIPVKRIHDARLHVIDLQQRTQFNPPERFLSSPLRIRPATV